MSLCYVSDKWKLRQWRNISAFTLIMAFPILCSYIGNILTRMYAKFQNSISYISKPIKINGIICHWRNMLSHTNLILFWQSTNCQFTKRESWPYLPILLSIQVIQLLCAGSNTAPEIAKIKLTKFLKFSQQNSRTLSKMAHDQDFMIFGHVTKDHDIF